MLNQVSAAIAINSCSGGPCVSLLSSCCPCCSCFFSILYSKLSKWNCLYSYIHETCHTCHSTHTLPLNTTQLQKNKCISSIKIGTFFSCRTTCVRSMKGLPCSLCKWSSKLFSDRKNLFGTHQTHSNHLAVTTFMFTQQRRSRQMSETFTHAPWVKICKQVQMCTGSIWCHHEIEAVSSALLWTTYLTIQWILDWHQSCWSTSQTL